MTNAQERIVLIGQGAIEGLEESLVGFGKMLDFEVVVMDPSPMPVGEPNRLTEDPRYDVAGFRFSESDSVIVLTHSSRDVDVLHALSGFKLRYVGLLGDSQRQRGDAAGLRALGTDEKFISSIKGPVGADIGARTPQEIALSIMAEVVATKYGKPVLKKELRPA